MHKYIALYLPILPYRTAPDPALPDPTLTDPALPYRTLPYPAAQYNNPALPDLALPHPTAPCAYLYMAPPQVTQCTLSPRACLPFLPLSTYTSTPCAALRCVAVRCAKRHCSAYTCVIMRFARYCTTTNVIHYI